jgi:two-component system, sensor histidine kinase
VYRSPGGAAHGTVAVRFLDGAIDPSPFPLARQRFDVLPGVSFVSATRRVASLRILLVEDDLAVRDATRLLLKLEGYEVVPVGSLAEALQRIRELDALDLLVTDYHLRDGETGIQVITAVREMVGRSLGAVLMTGDPFTATNELPVDPSLRVASKPIRTAEFLGLIKSLLSGC